MQILAFATAFVGSCALVVGFDFLVLAKIDQRFVDWISPQVTRTDTPARTEHRGRRETMRRQMCCDFKFIWVWEAGMLLLLVLTRGRRVERAALVGSNGVGGGVGKRVEILPTLVERKRGSRAKIWNRFFPSA